MKKTTKSYVKAGGMLSFICIGFIAVLLLLSNTGDVIVEQVIRERQWQLVPMGDAAVASGQSGILRVYIHIHNLSATPYNLNLSVSNTNQVWGYADANNTHISDNINYSEAFDIVYKVRWNATHCLNGTVFNLDWIRGNLTVHAFSVADQAMAEQNITGCNTDSTYIWVHYYDNNSGSGYTISRGQNVTHFWGNFSAYY